MNQDLARLMGLLTCVTYDGDRHTGFNVEEADANASLRRLQVKGENGDWFVFCPEKGQTRQRTMSPLLARRNDCLHHKACDAVLVHRSGGRLRVVYIELKSGSHAGADRQLRSTSCFVQYLLAIGARLCDLDLGEVDERYVVFHQARSLRKTGTRPAKAFRPSSDMRHPQVVSVKNGQLLWLNQLLA